MKNLGLNEIREEFMKFFESKDHLRIKSASLVPHNDKSLLLINSGMAPLKSYFTGQEVPPSKRVTNCQKCIRTGDIENVGITARHGTFFEMLGNFSFGDYFKKEIIPWSYEFCTEVMGLEPEKLHVSVYLDDDEAYDIWHKVVGLPHERIVRLGKEHNFWEVGLGPCGPCSEIHYDKGEEYGCDSPDCGVGCECDRYMEIWNLVFTQYNKEEDGSYTDLEHPNIDTGMGLERMATVLQGVNSIFEIDTLKDVRNKVSEISGKTYGQNEIDDVSIRIITDHVRSVTFMIADGILPSNEGRGYVLRRLLRRAIRHGKRLGIDKVFLNDVSKVAIENSKGAYPELSEKEEYIFKIISVEEDKFHETLDQGINILKNLIEKAVKNKTDTILGKDAFKLYDTYGFPLELTKEMIVEENMKLNENDFHKEMEKQKQQARDARNESTFMGSDQGVFDEIDVDLNVDFVGYKKRKVKDVKVLHLIIDETFSDIANKDDEIAIILDKTPFYGQSGGQVGDIGVIKTETGKIIVNDTLKTPNGNNFQLGTVIEGTVKVGQTAKAKVRKCNRLNIARNHTATHLLHKALKNILGNQVEQGGSLVSSERLTFDFTYFEKITNEELMQVQDEVNKMIFKCLDVNTEEMSMDKAREKGATALFNEKYGDKVRVVEIDDYSMELCGGTHVKNTSVIGMFKITGEASVGSGLRRIQAVTGEGAYNHLKQLDFYVTNVSGILKATPETLTNRLKAFMDEKKRLESEIEKLSTKSLTNIVDDVINSKILVNNVNVIAKQINNIDSNSLKAMGDQIKEKLDNSLIILSSWSNDKVNLVVMASDEAVKAGAHAGNIIKGIAPIVDGSGGGRPNMAQGGGKNKDKIDEAMEKALEIVNELLD